MVTPLAGIQQHAGAVEVLDLTKDVLTVADEAAVAAADAAVVVVGLTAADEGEAILAFGGDRTSLDPSPTHSQIVSDVSAHNPNTVVILEGSGAIVVESVLDGIRGLLMAWYPGMEGATPSLRSCSGRRTLPESCPSRFPCRSDSCPRSSTTRTRSPTGSFTATATSTPWGKTLASLLASA